MKSKDRKTEYPEDLVDEIKIFMTLFEFFHFFQKFFKILLLVKILLV